MTDEYCTVLYCTVLYCTVLYCTVLYCTVLYCTVLYCTVLYCGRKYNSKDRTVGDLVSPVVCVAICVTGRRVDEYRGV